MTVFLLHNNTNSKGDLALKLDLTVRFKGIQK